ncbi:exonuclease [Ligilactobacillus salivarius]|uniref:AAA family ATPase n=1 Tax=Ligilactobacillus salivarius TaxID=1624 RepID=UPI000B394332|nr:SMC family ATPase [Ligilactobacillus salivarius]OUQ32366.1 exonuclease [Ligilactobacillus salivarius]
MKPLKLRMKYFGPYIDETMNFTEFDNTPLFLISGKTGSGKTTIFDAMSFALFDHTSGDERDAKQMRSDFATPNDATEVTFVFEHNGIKYTVIRSPKMNLAKKRGNGTRDVEASVKVKYINKEQENIEITKKNQVDKFLRDLIGLDAQQFTQIVLLPQGKFRNFLNANSADREKILRKLFGTSLYQKWTEKIQEQAKINESENEKLITQIQTIRQQVEIEDNDEINDEEWIVKVNNQIEEKKKKQEKVNNDITISQKQLDNLVETYQNEKVLADSIKQKEDNIHKLQSLENNQDKIELKKIYAYKLAWYQKNQQIFNNKTDLELQIKEKSDKLVLLNQESKFLIQKHESAKIEAQELEKQQENIENLKNKTSTLEVKLPIYQDVKVNQEKLDNLDKNHQDTKNRLDNSVKELEKQKVSYNDLEKKLAKLENLDEKQVELVNENNKLTRLSEKIDLVDHLDSEIESKKLQKEKLEKKYQEQEELVQESTDTEEKLNTLWIKNQIYFLAKQLAPGEPCPICGSKEHPLPAKIDELEQVTEEDVKLANKKAEIERSKAKEFKLRLTSITDEITELEQNKKESIDKILLNFELGEKHSLLELQEIFQIKNDEYQKKAKDLENKVSLREKLKGDSQLIKNEIANLEKEKDKLKEQYDDVYYRLKMTETTLQEQKKQLNPEFNDVKQVEEYITDAKNRVEDYQASKDKITKELQDTKAELIKVQADIDSNDQELESKKKGLSKINKEITTLMENSEINLEEIASLAKDLARLDSINNEINSYEKQILIVKTKISELDKTINNREMPNLVERNSVIADKRKELLTFQAEFSDITTEINHIQKIKQEVEQLLQEQKGNYKLMAEWKQLSDVMTGKSATKLSLERYVLQMYLQRVLNVANGRLKELTQGRYSFQIKDEKGSYSSNTGLEINIYDDNAGKVRPVQTLSGGESFIAALALALALGEVIQANAGGIFVDALFVDEGFGSLDSDALQIALEALQTIEGKNRMIGIISHVKELQEQIPFQVKISSNYGKSKISYRKDF